MSSKQEFFNTLHKHGFSYDQYTKIKSNHDERMQNHWNAVFTKIQNMNLDLKSTLNLPLKILVIAEAWCGDCANSVPIISCLAKEFSKWELRIVLRDENEETVLKYYTTAGKKKIPIVIFADIEGNEILRWVERPARSYKLIRELKSRNLPNEEYRKRIRSLWELKIPSLSEEILRELLEIAEKTTNILSTLK